MTALASSNLGKALSCQMRVVGSLILREMRVRFGRSQLGYLWAVAEPLAYVAAFSAMFHFINRHPPFGNSMAIFFATGILPFQMFRNLCNQLAGAFNANQALLSYPIVQPIDTVIARTILEVATSLFIILIVLSAFVILGNAPPPTNILRLFGSIALLTFLGFGFGLMSAVIITHLDVWQNVTRLIMGPMLFLSGVFYSLDMLPPSVRAIAVWNPIIHGVEMFRDGYYSNYRSADVDPFYLFVCGILLAFVGLAMERTVRGRIE